LIYLYDEVLINDAASPLFKAFVDLHLDKDAYAATSVVIVIGGFLSSQRSHCTFKTSACTSAHPRSTSSSSCLDCALEKRILKIHEIDDFSNTASYKS
jgi:hypothetical protein